MRSIRRQAATYGGTVFIKPKNWGSFQQYTDRRPPWIKLHRTLLDDYEFQCLQVASRALAPMLWLLASEHPDGQVDATPARLAFRLRWSEKEIASALKPLIDKGFFVAVSDCLQGASTALAPCTDSGYQERETETETETDGGALASAPKKERSMPIPDDFKASPAIKAWYAKKGYSEQLSLHVEHFIDSCKAKGYRYIDFDAALRKAIDADWARLRQAGPASPASRPSNRYGLASGAI